MKKTMMASLALVFVCNLAVAKPLSFRVGGGADVALEKNQKLGFHGAGGADISVAPGISVLGLIGYHSLPIDSSVDVDPFTILTFNAELKYGLLGAVPSQPYLLGGIGLASWKMPSVSALVPETSKSDFMFTLGAGVEFGTLFVEARYASIILKGGNSDFLPISVGVKF